MCIELTRSSRRPIYNTERVLEIHPEKWIETTSRSGRKVEPRDSHYLYLLRICARRTHRKVQLRVNAKQAKSSKSDCFNVENRVEQTSQQQIVYII